MPPKGILKTSPSQEDHHSAKHVQWDEQRLLVTEAEKSAFARGQLSGEPKTPFHRALDNPQAHEIEELELMTNEGESGTLISDESSTLISDESNTLISDESSTLMLGESNTSLSTSSATITTDSEAESTHSSTTTDDERHERFLALRAQHYLMKGARELGHQLSESEEE